MLARPFNNELLGNSLIKSNISAAHAVAVNSAVFINIIITFINRLDRVWRTSNKPIARLGIVLSLLVFVVFASHHLGGEI